MPLSCLAPLVACLGRQSASSLLFVCQHADRRRGSGVGGRGNGKGSCLLEPFIKAPHANCANPFKGKAARRRCRRRRLSTRFSHCCCLPLTLSPSRSARLNTQTVDEATCLENNLKAQKVSKATRIGTYPSPSPLTYRTPAQQTTHNKMA